MNRRLFLSLLTGLLLAVSWPLNGFPLFLLVAFIPILFVEDELFELRQTTGAGAVYKYALVAFGTFSTLTTYWIYNSTFLGAVVAQIVNSLLMSTAFWLFHLIRRRTVGKGAGYIVFVFAWISAEFLHHHWDLNFPWLSLGNGFAMYPQWIQWYEFTGIFGGTLWVLLSNVLLFKFLKRISTGRKPADEKALGAGWLAWVLVPLAVSLIIYANYEEKPAPLEVLVVQPNLDPYSEQYETPSEQVIDNAWNLGLPLITQETDFVVYPESMVQPDFYNARFIWENNLYLDPNILHYRQLNAQFPKLNIISGFSTYRLYPPDQPYPESARITENMVYDAFNTAIFFQQGSPLQLSHKSRLTPGVEIMPFSALTKPLSKLMIDLGGTTGQLGVDETRQVFRVSDTSRVGVMICYESVYGEFAAGFARNGAQAMFVITNDGWWGNTPGHRQHMSFSALRAIEMRRNIARSANTGISCFVNQRGDIQSTTRYWEPAALKGTVNLNDKLTVYARYGDYIARGSIFGLVLIVLLEIARPKKRLLR